MRMYRVPLLLVMVVVLTCPFSLPWVKQGGDALVGKWAFVPPTRTPAPSPAPGEGTPAPPSFRLDLGKLICAVNYPNTIEFFPDGTYAAPPRPVIPHNWNGSTYEVLEDGRLRVDLGGKYGVFTFRVEGDTLILAAEDCPEVRYRREE